MQPVWLQFLQLRKSCTACLCCQPQQGSHSCSTTITCCKVVTLVFLELQNRILGRAKSSGRMDDNEEAIAKRLKTFEDETLPVR